MTEFTDYIDLASERLGGAALIVSDDFFASKDNLLKPKEAVWDADRYTDRGKWMDGWESRRKRGPGHDWCIVRLGLPGLIRGVVVDTAYFRGNYPESCSLEACVVEGNPSPEELASDDVEWVEILGKSALEGNSKNLFEIESRARFTHLRFHIYPDGGVARLRVHGEPLPDLGRWARVGEIDLVGIENGGRPLCASDMFFSHPINLLMPMRGEHMGDGWETTRRRGPGHDWTVLQLGAEGCIEHIEVDTNHFKGNYPDSFSLEGCCAPESPGASDSNTAFDPDAHEWREIYPQTKLQAHARHHYDVEPTQPYTHVRLNMYPDGGISRLRLHGKVSGRGWQRRKLEWLNTVPAGAAHRALLSCCGSTRWADAMQKLRPFASLDELQSAGDAVFEKLSREDWLEAFAAHPKIGDRDAASEKSRKWAAGEQAGAARASDDVLERLRAANIEYQERHGFIFIICATGKSADAMLTALETRLGNEREDEIVTAAREQQKITRLRLEKLIRRP
jgi:allantoicase